MNQQLTGGVFDKPQKPRVDMTPRPVKDPQERAPAPTEAPAPDKVNMLDEFEASRRMQSDISNKASSQVKSKMEATEDAIAKANSTLSGAGGGNAEKELDEFDKISEKDQELAESLIFNGYAEFEASMVNLPKMKFTLCSTSADDVSLVDEMVFEYVKSREDPKTGNVELPDSNVRALRMSLTLSLAYKGPDGKDLMESPVYQLQTVKKAIQRCKELEFSGDMDKVKTLRAELKGAVRRRAAKISSMPTPLIDYLNQQRYEFDSKMYGLMTTKNLLPKF